MRRTSLIVTAVFVTLLVLLESLLALYWSTLLEPRLRRDAESHAKLLAQAHEAPLVKALRSGQGEARRTNIVDAMDRILLLQEPASGSAFVTAIRLEVDYDVVPEPVGSLDFSRGEPGQEAFTVDVALYDPDTFELLGIAWIDMSPAFFKRLSADIRRQLIMQGVVVLLILAGVWTILLVVLGKLERTSEARRRAEQRLVVHEKKFGRLLDDLGTYFVYSRDRDGRLVEVSNSVSGVLGVTPAEFRSGYRDLLTKERFNDTAVRRLTSAPRECGPGRSEIEIRDASGGLHRIELAEVLINDEGGTVVGVDGIAHDVTEQRAFELALHEARELAEEANLAKSQFLANVSHEIRTPMNAILGMTVLALRTELDSRQRDYLGKIHSSGRLLLRLINDILDLSRIEAGKLTMQRVDFRLDDVLNDLSGVVGERAREKGLEILFSVAPDVPRSMSGDPVRLEQVLVNLVSNAVKFTGEGEIVVTVSAESVSEEGYVLRFEVRDTGPGIPEDEIARLFEPFTQVDESASRQYGGVGLGLAISKRLVELMGGEIECDSTLGEGSRFHFTIMAGVAEKAPRRALRRDDLEGLSVLVVDDNPTARQVFAEMLRSLGFDVASFSNAEVALEEIQRRDHAGSPFSLVLMDWKMPGLDGIEATSRLKDELADELVRVPPVVLVTAYGGEDLVQQAEDAGVDVFVHKPVSRSALWNAVLAALGRRDAVETPLSTKVAGGAIRFRESLRVLLVEDNELNREVARELLGGAGLGVDEAADGLSALEMIRSRRPDAVLMDVHMPGMDGLEVTRRIRSELGEGNLPIIALTAHAMIGDRQRFLDSGMDDYIAKPVEEEQLFEVLARWLPHEKTEVVQNVTIEPPDLPDIPGVDVPRAVGRLRGDTRLLRRLTRDLAARFGDAAAVLQSAIEAGDIEKAVNLAHTLTGAAGSLAARRISDAAGAIERALRSGEDAVPLISPLADALEELVDGQRGHESAPDAAPVDLTTIDGLDIEGAREAVDKLVGHLSENSLGAVAALETLRGVLGDRYAATIGALQEQIDSLRFDDAKVAVEEMRRHMGLAEAGERE